MNKQFNSILSYHIPVDFNGALYGIRNEKGLFLGYTTGLSFNYIDNVVYGFRFPAPNTSSDIFIKKNFYIAPHLGFNSGLNFNRICLSIGGLFHILVPEFVTYQTSYLIDNRAIIEINTNKSFGVSFKIGLSYRF
jgi:hypothetical protein